MKDPADKLTQALPGVEPPRRGRPATGQASPTDRKRAQLERDRALLQSRRYSEMTDSGLVAALSGPFAWHAWCELGVRRRYAPSVQALRMLPRY